MSDPNANRGPSHAEPLLFERSAIGRRGIDLPRTDVEASLDDLPADCLREDLEGFPELSELDVLRHFLRLSQWNYSAATNFYPLGSCTMKYNPIVNEKVARLPGFAGLHPAAPSEATQGALELMDRVAAILAEVVGMDAVSLQPAAGAQGELVGLKMIRALQTARGNPRKKVLVPESAHGTNPASCTLSGYEVVSVKATEAGVLDPAEVARHLDDEVAALMVTNPNTLGLFEREIAAIAEAVHAKGALLYLDGANMNALMGVAKPGDMGADVLQFNLHKTFSTPHGGGGPGAGPVAVKAELEPFLPTPRVVRRGERYELSSEFPQSIGRVHGWFGNFGMLVRAYAYLLALGGDGMTLATRMAILNANYVRSRLEDVYDLPYEEPCLHEVVFSDKRLERHGVKTLDLAKRLLDYGFYAPTIYFPLVVSGAIMIEPTESESKETLDEFIEAMREVAADAARDPEIVRKAPHQTRVSRLDEVRAARKPVFRWEPTKAG